MKLIIKYRFDRLMLVVPLMVWSIFGFAESNQTDLKSSIASKSVNLKQVLQLSFNRVVQNNELSQLADDRVFDAYSWLAAPASIELGVLNSQQDAGPDEIEVSLNLPLNSAFSHRNNKQLISVNQKIIEQFNSHLMLNLSGTIRELVWDQKIAVAKQAYYDKKLNILTQLENSIEKLFAAGESSDYGLLLVQNEKNNTRIEILSNQKEQKLFLKKYQKISGLSYFPIVIDEPIIKSEEWSTLIHPSLQSLESQWKQQQLVLRSQSASAEPWKLSLKAKRMDSSISSEDQIGISFEMPLSVSEKNSRSNQNNWVQAKQKFENDYQQRVMNLQIEIEEKQTEKQYLLQKNKILQGSVKLNQKIMQKLDGLQAKNEIGQEVLLRRILQALSIQSELEISKLLVQKNNSMSRQTLGMTL